MNSRHPRQYHTIRIGQATKPDDGGDLTAWFLQNHPATNLHEVPFPASKALVAIIAGTVEWRLTAFVVDDHGQRLIPILRNLVKCGASGRPKDESPPTGRRPRKALKVGKRAAS